MELRLSRLGEIVRIPRITLLKRERATSMSASRESRAAAVQEVRRSLASSANSPSQRRVARAGEFHACLLRVRWSRAELRQGHFAESAREFTRALRAFVVFARRYRSYSVPPSSA